jgi:hypothetical protein
VTQYQHGYVSNCPKKYNAMALPTHPIDNEYITEATFASTLAPPMSSTARFDTVNLSTPEPTTLLCFIVGVLSLVGIGWWRRKRIR